MGFRQRVTRQEPHHPSQYIQNAACGISRAGFAICSSLIDTVVEPNVSACLQRCNFEPRDALKLGHPSRVCREKRQTVQFSFFPPPIFAAAGKTKSTKTWKVDHL